jgi:hypothetical protein
MVKEHKTKDEVTAFDISVSPDVRRLAEEVERTRKSRPLKKGDREIARIIPVDEDILAGYDPKKVRAAIRKYAGTLSEEEAERMIADLYAAREAGSKPLTIA